MKKTFKNLLFIDGIVNLLLGVLLLLFPFGIARILGVPIPDTHFYVVTFPDGLQGDHAIFYRVSRLIRMSAHSRKMQLLIIRIFYSFSGSNLKFFLLLSYVSDRSC
jgi:hypothetical protein